MTALAASAMIPASARESLHLYVESNGRCRPGSFLWAVICNDLRGAIAYADPEHLAALIPIVRFVDEHVPMRLRPPSAREDAP